MSNAKSWIFIILVLSAGCQEKAKFTAEQLANMPLAKRDDLPEPSGGFTLAVGDVTVTAEEVIGPVFEKLAQAAQQSDFERFQHLAGRVIEQQLVLRISEALLYSTAKKDAGENIDAELDRATAAEVKRFVMDFGGDYAKAEEALKQMGMDWGRFEQYQKRKILSQSYIAQQLSKEQPITYSEMQAVYDETKNQLYTTPGVLQFRLIDIDPARIKDIEPNKSGSEQARELAAQLFNRIKDGESFEQLAKKYSHDHRAPQGGLWRKVDPTSLAPPYDVLADKAESMKPGDVTDVIENQGRLFIMQLVEYQPKSVEPFEKVQNQVKARINFDRLRKRLDKFNADLMQQASTADKAKFVDFCVHEIYRLANK
ncbi:MAG: peptidyl-prolyl cis-trans isomerase [Sedimentisphaerales bacterium]|nr:peptidyl-prolyl cis-trans isomerase [Sedimentisphaerales bacterium]